MSKRLLDLNRQSEYNPRILNNNKFSPYFGVYTGEVMQSTDNLHDGRILVFVPALHKDRNDKSCYITCYSVHPFAGATPRTSATLDEETYEEAKTSYGMWCPVPEPGNFVLITFADGNKAFPYVIGSVTPNEHRMLPGMAGDANNLIRVEDQRQGGQKDAQTTVHHDATESISNQGLLNDPSRGPGTASSERESPSEVFGILTPGPKDSSILSHRKGGHQFIMDDNENSRQIRIRTALGNQVLLDDTTGFVYIINKGGTAWFELAPDGSVHVFSEKDINLRAVGDVNLRSDKTVNIEAEKNVNIKSVTGEVKLEAATKITNLAGTGINFTATKGEIGSVTPDRISLTCGTLDGLVKGGITWSSGARFGVKAKRVSVDSSGRIAINGSRIDLNGSKDAVNAPAETRATPSLPLNTFADVPAAKPEYTRSNQTAPTTGERPGQAPEIKTIVSQFPTREPWPGHSSSPSTPVGIVVRDSRALAELRPGAVTAGAIKPANIETKAGKFAGAGFASAGKIPSLPKVTSIGSLSNTLAKTGTTSLAAASAKLPNLSSIKTQATSITKAVPAPQLPSIPKINPAASLGGAI
jgi:hypothetical protein